jgi:Uma2 family endonuclease
MHMNVALRRAMTVDEYLAWGDAQAERVHSELINGQVVVMAPERVEHAEIKFATTLALRSAIARAGVPCHALVEGVTVRIEEHTAYEPDALVYCGERLARGALTVPNPIIVVEVLSPTTAHTDTSAKLIGYFKLASVAHYLVIDPDLRRVIHHTRERAPAMLTAGPFRLDPPGIELVVEDLFGDT